MGSCKIGTGADMCQILDRVSPKLKRIMFDWNSPNQAVFTKLCEFQALEHCKFSTTSWTTNRPLERFKEVMKARKGLVEIDGGSIIFIFIYN